MSNDRFYASIFNDVLAPVTQGPSSSNTVGPFRIGTIARSILQGQPKKLTIEMCEKGGYAATFYNMESDKAFLSGLLGRDLIKDDLAKSYDEAEASGLEYEFVFNSEVPPVPTELAILKVSSDIETLTITGITLGGGEILISEINGQPVEIKGMYEEELKLEGSDVIRKVPSVYPLNTIKGAVPVFGSSVEMVEYAQKTGKPMWEVALDYEVSLTGMSREAIMEYAESVLDIMYKAMDEGFKEGVTFEGITIAKAPEMVKKLENTKLIPTGISDKGSMSALAIMEYSNSHGIIVCMPTGGATGIISSAIKATAEELGQTKEDQVKALLVAGLMGTFYYPTHYHGALGCQAEVGIAVSQAAAALASMISEDPEAIEHAAVLGIQYVLGQVCDPVEGYAQIPCFIRNIASIPVAATCANYAVLGLDTAVTLDEMVKAVIRVGEALKERRINDRGTCECCFTANPMSTIGKKC